MPDETRYLKPLLAPGKNIFHLHSNQMLSRSLVLAWQNLGNSRVPGTSASHPYLDQSYGINPEDLLNRNYKRDM